MKPNVDSMEPKIAEQAARWLVELEDAASHRQAEFAAWLKQSPQHVQEFLLATAAWKEFDDFDPAERLAVMEDNVATLAPRTLASHPAGREPFAPRSRAGAHRGRWAAAAGLAMLALVAGVMRLQPFNTLPTLATGIGEQRMFTLADGSTVELNTRSRAEIDYSSTGRTIRLLEGEALFSVKPDPSRPFRVQAGNAVVRALGTQFNVYRRSQGTRVAVIEGVVQVSERGLTALVHPSAPLRLKPGEQADLEAGPVRKSAAPDVSKAVAWRAKRLVFRGDSLEVVAGEFNRYNRSQIELEEGAVRAKRLTGVFDVDDPQSLLEFLRRDPELALEQLGNVTRIHRAR